MLFVVLCRKQLGSEHAYEISIWVSSIIVGFILAVLNFELLVLNGPARALEKYEILNH
jgi:hypothetical protein